MSKLSAIKVLKESFDALLSTAPTSVEAGTQTENEMHFSSKHCVAMATTNGNAIIRYNNAITYDDSTINKEKKNKKRPRSNSEVTLGTLETFTASPVLSLINPDDIENTPPQFINKGAVLMQEDDAGRSKACACCGQDWANKDIPTVFGYTKPDAYGRSHIHTHCVGCRSFKKCVRKGTSSPGNSSVVTTRLRHSVLKKGLNEVCVLRKNGETWRMAYQRLKCKHGDFLANRKDELIRKLTEATGIPLEQGYVLYSHYTNIELFYRVKRIAPNLISSKL